MKTLRELFEYNDWAIAKLMGHAAALPEEAVARVTGPGDRSLLGALHHIWGAERLWLDRWLGKSGARFQELEPGLGLAGLGERLRSLQAERNALVAKLDPEGGKLRIRFTNSKGTDYTFALGDMMLHVMNHGAHHRAQLAGCLRRLGVAPSGSDYLFMRLERPSVALDPRTVAKLREAEIGVSEDVVPAPELSVATLVEYFRYADWARDRMHAAATRLDGDRLDRRFDFGLGTLRLTLSHIRDAENWWLEAWLHGLQSEFKALPATTSLAELEQLFETTAGRRNAYLQSLDDSGLQRVVTTWAGKDLRIDVRLGETALQLCLHGTHHRAQAADMLRLMDVEPPELDYIDWIHETASS